MSWLVVIICFIDKTVSAKWDWVPRRPNYLRSVFTCCDRWTARDQLSPQKARCQIGPGGYWYWIVGGQREREREWDWGREPTDPRPVFYCSLTASTFPVSWRYSAIFSYFSSETLAKSYEAHLREAFEYHFLECSNDGGGAQWARMWTN